MPLKYNGVYLWTNDYEVTITYTLVKSEMYVVESMKRYLCVWVYNNNVHLTKLSTTIIK